MKRFYLIFIITTLFFTGCAKDVVYIKPDLPKLEAPRKVKPVKYKIRNKNGKVCLWRKGHNTNLCGEDLKEIMNLIYKLRINESSCKKIINEYNSYIGK